MEISAAAKIIPVFLLRGRVSLLTDNSPPVAGTRRHLLKMLLPIIFIVLCTLLLRALAW